MGRKLGVLMDPIGSINFKKDTTLALLWAAQDRGYELFYFESSDLYLSNAQPMASCRKLIVHRDSQNWADISGPSEQPINEMDIILMRKDPPFDMEYIYATYLLERAERQGTLVVNRCRSLRDCNEKLFATDFPECCPPLLVSKNMEQLRSFHRNQNDVIFKPLDGMGGTAIFRAQPNDPNLAVMLETLTAQGTKTIMAQKYIPEIIEGDKRILMIDGKAIPWSLARVPVAGESRGNLAAGGYGRVQKLSRRDHWIAECVGPVLVEKGLFFAGLDVIGDYLTEINITSPTCVREIEAKTELDIAGKLLDILTKKLG